MHHQVSDQRSQFGWDGTAQVADAFRLAEAIELSITSQAIVIDAVNADNTVPTNSILRMDARIDCRTPNANIRYSANVTTTNITQSNFDGANMNAGISANNNLAGANPTAPTAPANNGGRAYTNGALLPLGATAGQGNANANGTSVAYNPALTNPAYAFEGYQWRINARAYTANNNNDATRSVESQEMAYRTVLTYVNGANISDPGANDPGQQMGVGDQLWIRGGNLITAPRLRGVHG